jgi:DNA-binding transcriptional MerR regulator
MYSISEVSKRIHVHNQTLRNWERGGLLKPQRFGFMRIFSDRDIQRCEEIKRYSRRGVSLRRVRALLQLRFMVTGTKSEHGGQP